MNVELYIKQCLIGAIRTMLEQCTDKQRAFFERLYSRGIDGLSETELRQVYALCDRTLRNNSIAQST